MRSFMLGAGFATGALITGLLIIRWALKREYIPMKDRTLDDDEWGEWVLMPNMTTTMN